MRKLTAFENVSLDGYFVDARGDTFAGAAHDLVDGDLAVGFGPASGSLFPLGPTTVTGRATDAAGNETQGTFTLTVVDTTPPALVLPGDLVIEATGPSGTAVAFSAGASDLVSGAVPLVLSTASFSTFPIGTTVVTATAADAWGNRATSSFTVTVRNTTAPVIASLSASPNRLWPPNHEMVRVELRPVVHDAVDAAPVLRVVSVSSTEPASGTGHGDTSPDWTIRGLEVALRAERSERGSGRVYTIVVAARDRAGNEGRATVTVTVPHDGAKRP